MAHNTPRGRKVEAKAEKAREKSGSEGGKAREKAEAKAEKAREKSGSE